MKLNVLPHTIAWMAKDDGGNRNDERSIDKNSLIFQLVRTSLLCQKDTESQSQSIHQMYYHSPNC